MSMVVAYEFRCDKTLPQMLEALRASTPWEWHERFSDLWDEYLSAHGLPNDLIVKIFCQTAMAFLPPEPGRYKCELKFCTREVQRRWKKLTNDSLRQLVPLLGATDVKPTDSYN